MEKNFPKIMALEEWLAELENVKETATYNKENFPFQLQEIGLGNEVKLVDDGEPRSNMPLGLGPFGFPDIKTELEERWLKPKPVFPDEMLKSSQKTFEREIKHQQLYQFDLPCAPMVDYVFERNKKDGLLDFDIFQAIPSNVAQTASNSISMDRAPAKRSDFVRGNARNIPFLPGGMPLNDSVKTNVSIDLLKLTEKTLSSVPPGFDRGMMYKPGTIDISSYKLKGSGSDDDLLQALLEEKDEPETKELAEIESDAEENEADEFLPDDDHVLISRPPKTESTHREWAHMIDVNLDFPDFHELVPELAKDYPFELDVFQKRAVYHLERNESVFVAAHTSAGKTVVAEYAIALANKHMTRAIYTSPIKALSNQKYRDFKDTFGDVGILTGDIQINPEAACVVMTTEILRSMLYRGADLIRDVEFVIFDEVHYVNDSERGVVWEEVIIMLPSHVTLILLSATVPNTYEFAGWVGRSKKKDIYVISTSKRPVPLEHHFFVGKDVEKIVDAKGNWLSGGYRKANDIINPPKVINKSDSNRGGRGRQKISSGKATVPQSGGKSRNSSSSGLFVTIVAYLKKKDLLPAIVFAFSKKKCEEYSQALTSADLTSSTEKSKIHTFIERSLTCLLGTDKELPQVLRMKELLVRGIAVHHSGLLPILKELVEILFTRGLVKVLFATETFAMGVNAPAKTVVFAMIRKHDGSDFRNLLPGEYVQMSGRAGRRGLDSTGMVIIACNDTLPSEFETKTMILGRPSKLDSQFRVTYNMVLNLLRVEAIRVEDMIKKSFFENATQKSMPAQEEIRQQSTKLLASIKPLECTFCSKDGKEFYSACSQILFLSRAMNEVIIKNSHGLKALSAGRVVVINYLNFVNSIGIILSANKGGFIKSTDKPDERKYWMLILKEKEISQNNLHSVIPLTQLNIPAENNVAYSVESIPLQSIIQITSKIITVDGEKLVTDHRPGDLWQLTSKLMELVKENKNWLFDSDFDWAKIKDFEFQESFRKKRELIQRLKEFNSYHCPELIEHYSQVHKENLLEIQLAEVERNISDLNLDLLPDYHQRIAVLQTLEFIDQDSVVLLKGRVACEINTADELVLTELIFHNFFHEFEPAEIIGLLSCFVFQEKSQSEPFLSPKLEKGIDTIIEATSRVANIQSDCGIRITSEEAISGLKFGLVEVVYEWALGMPFIQITQLTDILEGSIVRCIVRLSETCREVSSAARLMGDIELHRKMEEAAALIRRDIVFAASLYF